MSVAGLYNCIDSLSRFSCILFTTEFYVILYGLRLEASHLSLWRGVIISYSIHGCIAADWRSCSVLAVSLVFIVLYGIGIFRFRFLFCWYVFFVFVFCCCCFFVVFFFPVPLPVRLAAVLVGQCLHCVAASISGIHHILSEGICCVSSWFLQLW